MSATSERTFSVLPSDLQTTNSILSNIVSILEDNIGEPEETINEVNQLSYKGVAPIATTRKFIIPSRGGCTCVIIMSGSDCPNYCIPHCAAERLCCLLPGG